MKIDALPAGTSVFLDANCLIYAFGGRSPHAPACRRLLDQIEPGDYQGFTSAHVVAEVYHRLMTLEAAASFNRPLTGMANWLRRHPAEVQQLSRHRLALDELRVIPVTILPVTGSQLSHAADYTRHHGLLCNDALIVAVMRDHGLTILASHDADFDRVPGLTRYAPA